MNHEKKWNVLFYLSIFSVAGAFLTWSETTKSLPQELAFYKSWTDWIWMSIPIFTIYYSRKHKENRFSKKNTIVGIIAMGVLFFGGLFAFIPNEKINYKEIFEYENILQIILP